MILEKEITLTYITRWFKDEQTANDFKEGRNRSRGSDTRTDIYNVSARRIENIGIVNKWDGFVESEEKYSPNNLFGWCPY